MARPVTLCTGQWADLSCEDLASKCQGFGFDGMELACWGDHFEVDKAMAEDDYCSKKRATLEKYEQQVFAISAHLVGQAVCDKIDVRHKALYCVISRLHIAIGPTWSPPRRNNSR